ncbi:hypothetical protein G6F40_017321 [Rhizopus arrhizus]|nr:hypothetical protein G6F40_017321 [Rhizopus arrhizus]
MATRVPSMRTWRPASCAKSSSDAKAREVTMLHSAGSSVSMRAWRACRLGKASAPLIWRTNAVFFSTASMHVTDHMGRMIARTTPGRPPPDPTS